MEAIILIEIGVPTLRTEIPEKATKAVAKDLDMANKFHEATAVRVASYQQILISLYNLHVNSRAFRAGDLVLRQLT